MKENILVIAILFLLFGCKSNYISESEKQKILAELDHIYASDQEYAGIPPQELTAEVGPVKAWKVHEEKRDSISLINQEKIKALFKKYGYLGYKEVGEAVSQQFWISIQHADNDVKFQQEMLSALKKEVEIGNAGKVELAMLEDRVNINLNKKQRFGTQVTYNKLGQAIPRNGLVDSVNIEKIRAEYNLPPFKKYYNEMTRKHFEMNKENYLKNGLTGPKLYK